MAAQRAPEAGIGATLSVANKGPAHKKAKGRLDERKVARRVRVAGPNQSSRRFMNSSG